MQRKEKLVVCARKIQPRAADDKRAVVERAVRPRVDHAARRAAGNRNYVVLDGVAILRRQREVAEAGVGAVPDGEGSCAKRGDCANGGCNESQ